MMRMWRALSIMVGFFLFGLISVILSILGFIPFQILSMANKKILARKMMHKSFQTMILGLNFLGVIETKFNNLDDYKDATGCLFIANHPSLIDIALLISKLPNVDCIVKTSVWKNPFFYAFVTYADYINNVNPYSIVNTCIERLKKGENVLIFPEGTRSEPNQLHKFKRGFATIALNSTCKIVPITIKCDEPFLTKNSPWYRFPKKKVKFILNAIGPIDINAILGPYLFCTKQNKKLVEHVENIYKERIL